MRLDQMTTEEAAQARDAGAVALLPVGAIEPHGPHLPLATDVFIAEATAARAAERLEASGVTAVILPAYAYVAVDFSEGFAGAIGPSSGSAEEAIADVLVSILQQGFRTVALVNAHLEPAHIACLRSAVATAADRAGRSPLFPDVTRRALADRLTEEFRSGTCHAGRYETSLMMAVRPELVREEIRRRLPAVEISLVDAIQRGERTFREAGIDRAYCGDPAAASIEEGQATLEVLASMVVESVLGAPDARPAGKVH